MQAREIGADVHDQHKYLPVGGPLNSCFLLAIKMICSAALTEQVYEQADEQRYLVPPTLFPFVVYKV